MRNNEKAYEILNKITMGWNLGNFLDAHDKKFDLNNAQSKSINYVVNLWHNPVFNYNCLDTLKKANINCIRIPITWCNFINIDNNVVIISTNFIEYLKEIVDKALASGFVVIIDMHHDDQTWLKVACTKKEFKRVCNIYKQLWTKISYIFKDYNENLVFEGMNEIIDRSDPEYYDWLGKKKVFFKRISKLYKVFIESVRQFSDNNKERVIMISTYGAQIHDIALKNFKYPKDDNIIVDLHFYSKHTDIEYYNRKFEYVKKYLINKNIPIILGEIGTKKGFEQNIEIIKVYKKYADSLNIKCVLWDNGKGRRFVDRTSGKLTIDFTDF